MSIHLSYFSNSQRSIPIFWGCFVLNVADSLHHDESYCTCNGRIQDVLNRPTKWIAPIPNSEVQRTSNPEEKSLQKGEVPPKEKKSYEEDPKEWLRNLRHLKTIGLLSQEEYVEEEEKLRDAGLI